MKKHTIELRVRYEETDQMGFVYYANYLVWFEIARTEFFREKGIEYRKLEEEDKVYIPVVESYCRYKSPLKYDDLATITTTLAEFGKTRLTFEYEVKCGKRLAAKGRTEHAFINGDGKAIAVPEKVASSLSI